MSVSQKYSRILVQEDFDQLNTQYNLELDFGSASDYRHAQVIWNLHCKVEEQHIEIQEFNRKNTKSID